MNLYLVDWHLLQSCIFDAGRHYKAQPAWVPAFLKGCLLWCQSNVLQETQSATCNRADLSIKVTVNLDLQPSLNMPKSIMADAHHVFKDVFTQNFLLSKFQQHVVGLGKDNCSKKLQASLREVNIQHWVLAV